MMGVIERISRILAYISMGLVIVLMLLVSADVIGRYFFDTPVKGAFELSILIMVGVVFGGLAYTEVLKGHISIDILQSRLSPRSQAVLKALGALIGIVVFSLIGWQGIEKVQYSIKFGYVSETLHFPIYPFQIMLVVGAIIFCLVLISELPGYIHEIHKPKSVSKGPS
jgi:TRAP-type C4-dicarboxylate transport system permease small subunit